MTINRTHLAGLKLALAEIPVYGESADRIRALIAQAQAAPEAEPYGYLREVDGNIQLSIGPVRPADRSGGFATPWAAIFAAPQHDTELVELLDQVLAFDDASRHAQPFNLSALMARIDAKLATLSAKP